MRGKAGNTLSEKNRRHDDTVQVERPRRSSRPIDVSGRKKVRNVSSRQISLSEYLTRYELADRLSLGRAFLVREFLLRRFRFLRLLPWKKCATVFRVVLTRSSAIALIAAIVYAVTPGALSAPKSVSISTRSEWEQGTVTNVSTTGSTDAIQLDPSGSWGARVWAPTPEPVNAGHSSVSVGKYVYATRGQSDKAFWRYDTEANAWETLSDLPFPAYYGSDMTYVEATGDIYMIFGGYSTRFYRYHVEDGTWTRFADLLDAPYSGASLENDGTNVYFARGNGSTDFYMYDVAHDEWDNKAPVSGTLSTGADLVNGRDGYLYAVRGTTGTQVYRYNLSSNIWATVSTATMTIGGDQRGEYAGGYIYFLRAGGNTTFYRFSVSAGTVTTLSGTNEFAPMANNFPSLSYDSEEGFIYAIRGASSASTGTGTTDMWKFDPSLGTNGEWMGPKQVMDGSITLNTGSDLIWNGQTGASAYVYAVRGGNTNTMYRYDIATNAWSAKTFPYTLNTDMKGTYCDGYLSYLQPTSRSLHQFTESGWTTYANSLPANAGAGAGLACAADDSMYAVQGGGNTGFYRYVDGSGWSTLSSPVVSGVTYRPNVGARIAAIGADVYVMPGNGETAFLRYASDTWSTVRPTPFSQYLGTDVTVYNGKIYALAGYYKDELWEYTPGTDSWRLLPSDQTFTFGRGAYQGASLEFAGGTSLYMTPGQGLSDMRSYTVPATNYVSTGTYESAVLDLSYVDSWGDFTATDTEPANTTVTYETRTSDDRETWSAWEAVSGAVVHSPEARYLQVRIVLASSNGADTPTVSDISVAYNSEETEPTNPTGINAYSQNGSGQTLVSGTTYPYDHPYFQWSGASDTGSEVAGYYVYFGTEENADPEEDGVYQTAVTYTSNVILEQTLENDPQEYYLRIKAVDNDGNIAHEAWDAFTYVYGGASPVLNETLTTQADFDAGTFSDTASLADGSVRLSGVTGVWNQSRLSLVTGNIGYGGDLTLGACAGSTNHCLYTAAGNATNNFYRYEIETDTWSAMAVIPTLNATVYNGGSLVEGPPGYLFLAKGYGQSSFLQYDIVANSWTQVDSAPKNFDYGGNLSYDGSRYVYAMPGNDDAFYRYDTCNGETECTRGWTTLSFADFGNPNTVDGQKVYEGADSIYDGRNNVYVTQGNLLPYFAKYSVSDDTEHGETRNTWTPLSPLPEGLYDGGSLAFDAETQSIFAIGGNAATTLNFRQNFYRYDIATDTWSELPEAPVLAGSGASLLAYDGYLYFQRGGATTGFYRFNIADNTWELPQRGFFGPAVPTGNNNSINSFLPYAAGAFMASDGETGLYIVRGGNDNVFGKYDTATGEWFELSRLPVGAAVGASIVYDEDGKTVYYVPGAVGTTRAGFSNYFFRYDVATNTWSELTDRPAGQVTTGSSMTYDGDRYLYLTQGGSYVWWRYDTCNGQSACTPAWSTMTAMTAAACVGVPGDGSKIVYGNGYVYVTRGGGNAQTCRFTVATPTWTALGALPAGAGAGSGLTDPGDGYLYVTRGASTNAYYRYDTSQATPGTWQTVSSTPPFAVPALVTTGGVGASVNHRNWFTSGNGSITQSYADGLYSYIVGSSSGGTGFVRTGTYETKTFDLLSVYHFANLVADYTLPENTFVSFETRTSENGTDWSAWAAVLNDSVDGTVHTMTVNSTPAQYLQVRASLSSSDQVFSPTITSLSVNYYQDLEAPVNPTAVSGYSTVSETTPITSEIWYQHATPYFEWPVEGEAGSAADNDGGSGVAGYWVYFGSEIDADPYALGSFQTGTGFTASTLTSGQTYYLRVKAVDRAGMIPADAEELFVYRYDVTAPSVPSDISVTPTGYTSVDSYSFLWAADAIDAHSGIARYQYRTGGDDPDEWFDIDDPAAVSLSIPNAEHVDGAYQSGKNTLSLRVVDGAGNVSAPITQDYYFSASAPTPPQNLSVTPESSSSNAFAFSWETPASFIGDVTKLRYYYSVNALPTAYNTVETTNTFAGPGPFATQRGPNTFYVVAMDEAGNVDYALYAEVTFEADTSAPPVPVNVQAFDTSDRESAEYSVAVKWGVPAGIDTSNFAGYSIFRSLDGTDFEEVAMTTGSAYVDTSLESTLYYYYVKTKDRTNNYSIESSTVSLTPTGRYTRPPALVGEPKYTTQSFAASFTWATNRVASSFVEYGTSMSLGKTNGQVDSVTDHTVDLTGLSADTKYYYRVKFIDPDGNIGMSDISTFTTLPPPTVSEFTVTDITLETAYVLWKTNTSATCTLKYGAGGLSGSIEETAGSTSHAQKISGLSAETDYLAQVECVDDDLNDFSSDQYKFSTPVKPVATDIFVSNRENVDLPTVIVEYKTNVPTTTLVTFRHGDEALPHTYLVNEYATEHRAELEGLDPAKEYILSIGGTDQNGIALQPAEQKITTRSDSRPPEILTNRAVGKTVGRGKNSQANMYVKIETNEPTKVRINYAQGVAASNFEQSTAEDPLNTYHLITIPAEIGRVYSYQALVIDEAGNTTTSAVVSVVVEQAKETAAEVISGTISSRFGWIGSIWNQ